MGRIATVAALIVLAILIATSLIFPVYFIIWGLT